MSDTPYSRAACRFFLASMILTTLFCAAAVIIYAASFRDPRWRVFDFNSRQASEGEIYNVAEIPAIRKVSFAGPRKLRFEFTPDLNAESWTIRSAKDGSVVSSGPCPEIYFTGEPHTGTYRFEPEGIVTARPIEVTVSFYPGERYSEAGLSWPDNYYSPWASVPFSLSEARSLDEWAGLPYDDPDAVEARRIMEGSVDIHAPEADRAAQVFGFVMNGMRESGGTPTDTVQDASPLETWRMLTSGEGKGWCENRALVYYLFANAAGVKTRLVDVAGKFGPLKLTGHYFCESWDPVQCRWFLVDPMSSAARVTTPSGRLLNTLEIKRLFDVDMIGLCEVVTFDPATGMVGPGAIGGYESGNRGYFTGDIVIAWKCGYPKNRSFPGIGMFLTRPTLLYATFDAPDLYRFKQFLIAGCLTGMLMTLVTGAFALTGYRRNKREDEA